MKTVVLRIYKNDKIGQISMQIIRFFQIFLYWKNYGDKKYHKLHESQKYNKTKLKFQSTALQIQPTIIKITTIINWK